jgi:hypothetical protein
MAASASQLISRLDLDRAMRAWSHGGDDLSQRCIVPRGMHHDGSAKEHGEARILAIHE